ncbi:MAG: hypothetical protein LW650_09890 [Planctomycetaceae bacterium]|jgi:HEAT repeat protein|nr:hypothetical protein [Planctomycetaceae bacterium]
MKQTSQAVALGVCAGVLALAGLLVFAGCDGAGGGPRSTPSGAAASTVSAVEASKLREEALTLLLRASEGGTPEQRANAIEALIPVPQRLEAVLLRSISDANPGVRSVSAMAAGKARLPKLMDACRGMLSDPLPFVQASAILALGRNGEAVDPTPLAAMLRSPNPGIRAQAAFVLGELGNASALPLLKEAAVRPVPRADSASARVMYLQLAEAMIKLGDEAAVNEVRAALYPTRPEDLELAALAAQIIGQVQDRQAISQLVYLTAFQDKSGNKYPAEVRLAAAASLARLGNERGSFIADEFAGSSLAPLRAQSALVYGATGQVDNLSKLAKMLQDPEPLVRIAAAAAVVKITDRQGMAGG